MKSSLSISMIFSWLENRVSATLALKFEVLILCLRGGHPRENLLHNVVQRNFALDVRKGNIAKGLDFQLKLVYWYFERNRRLKVALPGLPTCKYSLVSKVGVPVLSSFRECTSCGIRHLAI